MSERKSGNAWGGTGIETPPPPLNFLTWGEDMKSFPSILLCFKIILGPGLIVYSQKYPLDFTVCYKKKHLTIASVIILIYRHSL